MASAAPGLDDDVAELGLRDGRKDADDQHHDEELDQGYPLTVLQRALIPVLHRALDHQAPAPPGVDDTIPETSPMASARRSSTGSVDV